MASIKSPMTFKGRSIEDPFIARLLFSDVRLSWLWLIVRVWLGYQWLQSGIGKLSNPAWISTGEALKGYWANQTKIPETGRPPISFDWYRDFLNTLLNNNAHTWFAPLIVWGELLVGVGLVVGAFVGIAAFFGALLNWNFIMAGSASTNGLMLIASVLLILAWKVAGYIGADFVLLRWLGVPWNQKETPPAEVKPAK